MKLHHFALGALAVVASACSSEGDDRSEASTGTTETPVIAGDIAVALQRVPGVLEVLEQPPGPLGVRYFSVRFEQPVDHRHPEGEKFSQRLSLIFRGQGTPMVLSTPGYFIGTGRPRESEPAHVLRANQIHLEHRFFGQSRPPSMDWAKLDIFQAASDAHRIVQAFRPLFPAKWLSTGGSKGGMTATFHRFFYPDDVFASVPYEAPVSYGTSDPAYIPFLHHVGNADCREKVSAFQVELLRRRGEIEARMQSQAAAAGDGYEVLGIHRALDFTVTETPFLFWQALGIDSCASVPPATASTDALYAFFDAIIAGVNTLYGNAALDAFAGYFYQSATELGGPAYDYTKTREFLTPHFRDVPQDLPPFGVKKPFRPASMPVIAAWVRGHGERMMYIYGANDPWASRPYEVRRENDSYRYFVPNGTHQSFIGDLPEAEQREALATLGRWMDVEPLDERRSAAKDDGVQNEVVGHELERRVVAPQDHAAARVRESARLGPFD